jgi:peptidoglycan/xylan/chitin deacetylase (PgdA/CDA1 family)
MSRFAYYPPILGYHRIGTFTPPHGAGFTVGHVPSVSAELFERHLWWLTRFRCRVLSLEDALDWLDRSGALPRRSVVITFDDGYAETYSVAWPLLKRYGFPATVFLATEEVGWNGFLTWDQVAEIAGNGITIGSHTKHHSYLPLVPPDRLREELADSKQTIEERLGRPVHFLSYPVGGFTRQVQAVVEAVGYRAACTTNRASPLGHIDRYALRRIKITERDANPLLFYAKLSGYYDLFRQLKQPY